MEHSFDDAFKAAAIARFRSGGSLPAEALLGARPNGDAVKFVMLRGHGYPGP
jgi:hypothetical protein